MPSKKALRVGILGLGHLHPRSYMDLFAQVDDAEVVACCDADKARREAFAADYGIAAYDSVEAALKNEKLDIAAIFLPHDECPDAAAKCAAQGVHLMVEKPMANTAAGAKKIVDAARKYKVQATTGYCWRLHPAAREFKNLIQSGIVGDIVGAEGRCAAGRLTRYIDGGSPWMLDPKKSGGGPIFNLGVHWIDLFRYMLEDEVAEASGRNVKVNKNYGIEDNSFAHLRFRKGAVLALDISYTVPDSFPHGRDLYVAVRGTRGAISWAPAYEGAQDVLFVCSDDPRYAGSPRRDIAFDLEPTAGYSGFMGLEYVRAFVRAVRTGTTPPITGEDGHAALKVVEAIYKAADEKKWVPVRK